MEHESTKAKEDRTNNVAEYMGLIELFKYLIDSPEIENIKIFGDSKLVIEQVKGNWRCKAENIKPYYIYATKLFVYLSSFKIITLNWVPRAQNTIADKLAQEGVL